MAKQDLTLDFWIADLLFMVTPDYADSQPQSFEPLFRNVTRGLGDCMSQILNSEQVTYLSNIKQADIQLRLRDDKLVELKKFMLYPPTQVASLTQVNQRCYYRQSTSTVGKR